jgi:hypothetical protein
MVEKAGAGASSIYDSPIKQVVGNERSAGSEIPMSARPRFPGYGKADEECR